MTKTNNKQYQNIAVIKLENSEVEITGEIKAEYLTECKKKVLKHIAKTIALPGFRKGYVPENIAAQHVGDMALLEEAGEMALNDEYEKILVEHKVEAIGRPTVTITKLAEGNPLGFKIQTAVMPEITLAPYKKIATEEMTKKEEVLEVTDKDIEDVILQVRKSRAAQEKSEASNSKLETKEGKTEDAGKDHNHTDPNHTHKYDHGKKDEVKNLPEFTDEFVQSLGDFKDIADFKQKIKNNMLIEKTTSQKEKKRIAIVDKIIEKSAVSLPKILVEGELEKMIAQFKDDVERAGMKYEDYLTHSNKKEEDLRKEWKVNAEKKAKLQLILNKIAIEEKIEPGEADVKKEIEHILKHHKDADKNRVRIYVETYLTNEKVLQFLENQK